MAKEICISSTPHETRLAILEDDQLAEIYYERENEYTLAGSIYKGRVTRVLPGMQSAFVDLGLERDAFLYVTDFVEIEEQDDADDVDRVAGMVSAPREVRHGNGRHGDGHRGDGQDQAGRRGDRVGRTAQRPEPRATEEPALEPAVPESAATGSPSVPELEGAGQEEQGMPGGRRWRGRRHRRGGRGSSHVIETPGTQAPTGESAETAPEPESESSGEMRIPETPRAAHPPSFVLPGESLSKYGGAPAPEAPKSASAPPPRSAHSSKPSTLVDSPLQWDGSGLLPGESLSAHRVRSPEPPAQISPGASTAQSFPEAAGRHELVEENPENLGMEAEEFAPPSLHEIATAPENLYPDPAAELIGVRTEEDPRVEEELFEEEFLPDEPSFAPGHDPSSAAEEAVDDASASHRVDPSRPSGFRFLGFGGKKKKEEEAAPFEPQLPPARAAVAAPAASAYAPGEGLVEEELIEGEELESSPHRRGAVEHDLDDYEEETLPMQIRSGDLGEMLQEAHLDHKIQLTFADKNGEDEEGFDIEVEDEGEEEPAAEAQPAPGQPAAPARERDRTDRGGRGRRGRERQGPGNRRGPSRRSAQTSDLPIISDLLKPGQEILVQIAKEPIAKKGARITSHIALPGRFLVFMPTVTHVGVSRKIASDEERHRLKRILVNERGESSGGFIVRTAADGASEDELRADLRFLMNLWNDIKQRSESSKSPALIYHDLSLIERILRDQVSANFSNIWVDSEADYERIVRFLNRFSPSLVRRVKLYTKDTPLFEHFGIQDEISKALRSKVWLKSGGSIVINQTEALVAIDINTGKYVGKSARLEDTILKTNLDAVPEIVRQIRLRDLGGIIVIDFIDMDERKNRFRVMAALEEALKNDRAPTKVLQFNDFGLVAITRKRVKQSLERTLSVPCPTCQATGMVKSPATVCNEIYIELRKMRRHFEGADVMIRVNPETVKILKSNNARWLNDFEDLVGKSILVKSDPTLHPEQFDIQG
jgi:Rne/Rng family ribonuclease